MQTLGNECKTEQQNCTQRTFGLFARTSVATLLRLVWPVQSEEVGRESSESARNARKQSAAGTPYSQSLCADSCCDSAETCLTSLHEQSVNTPRQIRYVRTSPDANVGERMQDRATKLNLTNVLDSLRGPVLRLFGDLSGQSSPRKFAVNAVSQQGMPVRSLWLARHTAGLSARTRVVTPRRLVWPVCMNRQ